MERQANLHKFKYAPIELGFHRNLRLCRIEGAMLLLCGKLRERKVKEHGDGRTKEGDWRGRKAR